MVEEEDFEQLYEEFINGGICEEKNHRYTCAVELYYKALLKIIDYLIFIEKDIVVDNHTERNKYIGSLNGDIKSKRDYIHNNIYRPTYKSKSDKTNCKIIKDGIKQIVAIKRLEGNFKTTSEKL